MITVNELTIAIQNCIAKGKAALINRGVAVSDTDTLYTIMDKIQQVPIYAKQPTTSNAIVTIRSPVNVLAGGEAKDDKINNSTTAEIVTDNWADYQEVEYITFPSGSYIHTSMAIHNHCIEMKLNDPSYVNDKHWFGSNSSGYTHFTTYNNKYYWGINGNEGNGGSYSSGIHTLKFNDVNTHDIVLDDVVLGNANGATSNNTAMYIGRRENSANFVGDVYYFKTTDTNGNLVHNLVPCYHKTNGTIGMFDKVSNIFYGNSGSGEFTKGPNIN